MSAVAINKILNEKYITLTNCYKYFLVKVPDRPTKGFSISKYGHIEAFRLAKLWRDRHI